MLHNILVLGLSTVSALVLTWPVALMRRKAYPVPGQWWNAEGCIVFLVLWIALCLMLSDAGWLSSSSQSFDGPMP